MIDVITIPCLYEYLPSENVSIIIPLQIYAKTYLKTNGNGIFSIFVLKFDYLLTFWHALFALFSSKMPSFLFCQVAAVYQNMNFYYMSLRTERILKNKKKLVGFA
jgi:hypothetical protein